MLAGKYLDVIAVYCARAWRISTWRTTGVWPMTSPPLTMDTVPLDRLKADVVYLRLHGMAGQPYLYGDPGRPTALSAGRVAAADFGGCIVFLEGCYGAEMAAAFLAAGARSVIGNAHSTWGRRWRLGPSSVVGREFLRQLAAGAAVEQALAFSQAKVPEPFGSGWTVTGQQDWRLA